MYDYLDVLLQNLSLFSKRRLFESDLSAMRCATLYRQDIRLQQLESIELRSDLI